jgi:hypothetical protein
MLKNPSSSFNSEFKPNSTGRPDFLSDSCIENWYFPRGISFKETAYFSSVISSGIHFLLPESVISKVVAVSSELSAILSFPLSL